MRILIAEDDQVLADGLLRTLRSSGAVVDHVGNGSEADAAALSLFVGQLDRRRWCTRSSRRPCTARSFLNSSLAPPSRGSNMFFDLVRVPAQRRPSSYRHLEAPHGD